MKITLLTNTPEPKKAIAAAYLNMGVGKVFTKIEDITDKEASDGLKEILKSHLDSPLEFASFNLVWEDIPLLFGDLLKEV